MTDTETQREFKHPSMKSIDHMKHIEENRLGRYAYSPNQHPPNGICKFDSLDHCEKCMASIIFLVPTFNAKVYPEVIPRFHLPKMP